MAAPKFYDPFGQPTETSTFVDPFAAGYTPPKAPLARGVAAAGRGLASAAYGVGALAAKAVGADELSKVALENSQRQSAEAGENAMRVEDIDSFGSLVDFLQYAGGYLGAQAATSVAGGGLGRVLGGLTARGAAAAATKAAAQQAGTVAGLAGTSLMQEVGQIYPEAIESGVNDPIQRALVGGLVAAGADLAPELYAAKRFGLLGKQATRGPGVLGSTARVGAAEAGTELFQTYVERASAGQPTTGPEAISDYLNSGVLGLLGGSLVGGVAGAYNRTRNIIEPEAPVQNPPASTNLVQPPEPVQPVAPVDQPTAFQNYDATGPGNEPTTTGALTLADTSRPIDLTVPDNVALGFKTSSPEPTLLGEQPAAPGPSRLVLPRVEGFQRSATDLISDNRIARAVGTFEVPEARPTRTTTAAERLNSPLPREPGPTFEKRPAYEGPTPIIGESPTTSLPASLVLPEAAKPAFLRTADDLISDRAATPPQITVPDSAGKPREIVKTFDPRSARGEALATAEKLTDQLVPTLGLKSEKTATSVATAIKRAAERSIASGAVDAPAQIATAIKATLKGKVKVDVAEKAAADFVAGLGDVRLDSKAAITEPRSPLEQSARAYTEQAGLAPPVEVPYAQVDPVAMKRIADAFEALPVADPAAEPSYRAFAAETAAQFEQASRLIRIEPWARPGQPYANSAEMRADVDRGHLFVFEGGEPHPGLTPDENFKFRAVHDLYGHAMTGFQFGPRGELNATRAHARMYSNEATPALVAETIGQNAWVNFSDANAGKPVTERAYAVQKAALLPESLWKPLLADVQSSRAALQERVEAVHLERGAAAIAQLEKILGTPENLKVRAYTSGEGTAGALHLSALKDLATMELNLGAKDVLSVANHEGFHYLEYKTLPKGDLDAVKRAIRPGQPIYEKLLERVREYDRVNGTQLADEVRAVPAEARAYAFEFWARGELEAKGIVERVFATLRRTIERISNAIRGNGFTSVEDVFRAIEAGYYARRTGHPLEITAVEDPYLADIEPDVIGETLPRDAAASAARGRPFWVKSPGDVRNMRLRLRLLAQEGAAARDWHARSGAAILRWANGDVARAAKLAALIANYSPRTPVGRDLVKALAHFTQWEQGRPIKVGAPNQHIKSANDILANLGPRDENDNVQPTGIKRQNFFRNLMLGIDPTRYNAESQGSTIDMWMSHAFNYGEVSGAVTKGQYNYADAEVKRLARELGWGTEETQAAIWVAIKARGDSVRSVMEKHAERNGWYEYTLKKPKVGAVEDMFGQDAGKYERVVKPDFNRAFVTQWMNFALSTKYNEDSFKRANYSYAEAFDDLANGRIGEAELLPYSVTEDTSQDSYELPQTMSLFSRAALKDLAVRARLGEIPQTQINARIAELLDSQEATGTGRDQLLERVRGELTGGAGGLKRAYLSNVSSGENLARQSSGYKNVFNALTAFTQRKNILIADAVERRLSKWVKGAKEDDKVAVSRALLDRTVNGWTADSAEYARMYSALSQPQREMFDQATQMIGDRLEAEFRADTAAYARVLGAGSEQYREWAEARRAQVEDLKLHGYFPERRYGDHVVHAYVEGENGKRLTLYYSQHQREADARVEENEVRRALAGETAVKVEYGYRYKADYDGSLSFQQFLDMANRHGISLTQAEKERLAKALVAADSVRRNRIFRRKNIAGYSDDGMRVLAEFGVAMANKIAYYETGAAVNDAIAGRGVSITFDRDGNVNVETSEGPSLWDQDGPMGGYYRNLADKTADFVLSPRDGSKWSRALRTAATVQFLGGSIAAGMVQLTSMAMNVAPWLTQWTGYTDSVSRTLAGYRLAVANHRAITDLPTLLNDSIRIDGVDDIDGLRHALQIAAQDGTILDTEIYQIMGLSRGQEFSFSGGVQKAIKAWMTPFRLTEQWNRIGTFAAAFKLAKDQTKSNDEAYKFAQEAVYSTQFRYDEANRPALARGDIGSLLFVFKSYPIFMLETLTHLAKVSPGSAATMLATLTIMAGVEGLPFAEDLEDLIDVISQRLFNSPFNTKRALRNMVKNASEAIVGADLSGVVTHGIANELTGMSLASRVGMGNLIPGTRFGAADTDYKRLLSEITGPVGTIVTGAVGGADALSRGDFTEAAKQALPLAGQNLIKGWEQWTRGYASDIGGRKLVDVDGPQAFWQALGFSSSALNAAYESDRIDRQTSAFYKKAHDSFVKDITKALQEGNSEAARRATDAVIAWNGAHPDMPMVLSPEGIRRRVQLAGLPMAQRTFQTMPRALRGNSEYAIGLADR